MSDVAVEYIELGLRLGRHVDGLVDSYYGPRRAARSRSTRRSCAIRARWREDADRLATR